MGCSEDLPYSLGRVSAPRFVPSCFCGRPDGARTARRTSIGTSSRIGVSTMAGWCSDRFCIWERSIRRRPPLGVKRSRYSTRRPESRERQRCSPRIAARRWPMTPRGCVFACQRLKLYRPRQWGACWLAGQLWRELQLDRFWADRLPPSRKGTRWDQVLQVLVAYRLIAPGSEWKLHRDWFGNSAMADLLGADFGLAEAHKLYACHDRLLEHKDALFAHLVGRWRDLFNARFDVLLYDLTSPYFEIDAAQLPEGDKRRHGYSRDHRPDCPQVVIALVVTPEGLPLAYEVLPGNTADNQTLRQFLSKIETQYGKARRVWVMDRGIPSEAVLAEMRQSDPPVRYLVGTPKGRLTRLEKHLLDQPGRRPVRVSRDAMGRVARAWHHRRCEQTRRGFPMPQVNDLSRCLAALDQDSTLIAVIEMSQSSWLVAGVVPGIERHPAKKLEPDQTALLRLLHPHGTSPWAEGSRRGRGGAGRARDQQDRGRL